MPWLLVHGSEDDVVPPQDASDILAKAGDNARLTQIAGADHVFSEDPTQMVTPVVDWVRQQTQD